MKMKRTGYIIAMAGLLTAGCNDASDVFYSANYPITKVEAEVQLTAVTTEEETPPIVQTITNEVLAEAPIATGGSYTFQFTRANGGRVQIATGGDAGTQTGVFVKTPGQTDLRILFGVTDYTCSQSSYTDAESNRKVLFTTDLTEAYKIRYPDAEIKQVIRKEYTSASAN